MGQSKLDRHWDDICSRFRSDGATALNENELAWANLAWFRYQVGNGGLMQYFLNPWDYPNQNQDTINALKIIGAGFAIDGVKEVSGLFGENVPFEENTREEIANSWAQDGIEDETIEQSSDAISTQMNLLDKLIDQFLLENDFCDAKDLEEQ